ncbi:hypothetical protein J7J18_01015 [bacterium]|nr:hypothetical protein [bacterium]
MPKRMPRSLFFSRYALGFNGSNNWIRLPVLTQLDGKNKCTFLACVNLKKLSDNQAIIWSMVTNSGFGLWFEGDDLRFLLRDGSTYYDLKEPDIAELGWHFYGGRYDGSELRVVKDGVLRPSATAMNTAVDMSACVITTVGCSDDEPPKYYLLYGDIAAIYVWYGVALTPEELRWMVLNYHNPVHPEYLVLWLPLEEGSGLTVYDKSGYGNNGTLLPADDPPTWQRVRQWELRQVI